MLLNLLSEINKAKKKFGDIPVIFVYDDISEMSVQVIDVAKVAYSNLDLENKTLIYSHNVSEDNFISVKAFDPETHTDFKPVLFLMGKS